jgi:hypothetical protein
MNFRSIALHRSLITAVTLLATGLWAVAAHAEDYVKSYAVSNRANVHVKTGDGSVTVTTGDTQQVEFHVEYQGYVLNKTLLIDSSQNGDEVELTARVPPGMFISLGFSRRLHIEVRMPKDADLHVATSDGSVKASGITGDVDLKSSDGSLDVSSLKGTLRMHTSDGSIEASDLDGRCDATTSDGRIRLSGRFDHLSTKSSDGSVNVEVQRGSKMDSDWSISSSDGSIEVALPGDLPVDIEASASGGRISSDIPITVEGVLSKSRIHGKLNGGGPTLNIHTSDGSIHLRPL